MSATAGHLHAKKIALLHVAKRQLGLSDEDYRLILKRAAGVDSASEVSDLGFERAVAEFTRLGFRSTGARRNFGHRAGFASPAQIHMIRGLWRDYHGADPDELALNAWLTRFHHISALRFVSAEKANGVLVALKRMVGRSPRAAAR